VRFDHGSEAKGRVERYLFAATASWHHTAALVVDLVEDKVPSEDLEQHFAIAISHNSENPNSSIQTTHDQENCCLI